MTTPGGVPNLPAGALTLDTLASKTQDMSGTAMKSRAVERFPSIFNTSTGLDPSLDITPFGILTRIWAEVNSLVANSDPADIQGPEDLPQLVLQFIEGLPVVGQFVELFAAILGNYTGTDATLLGIQNIFAPIRQVAQLVAGMGGTGGIPTANDVLSGWNNLLNSFISGLTGAPSATPTPAAVQDAMAAQTAASSAMAAALNALTQQNIALATGAILAIDAFARTGPDLGADWDTSIVNDVFTSGGVRTDGKQAVPVPGGFGSTRIVSRFIGANHTAATNRTKTSIVLGSPLSSQIGAEADVDILDRMSPDKNTFIMARLKTQGTAVNAIQLWSRVAGVDTLIGSENLPGQPAASTIADLLCGTDVSDRQFVVKVGGGVYTFTEVGTTSQLGAGFRERGVAWFMGGSFFGQAQAGAVEHWTSIDVASAPPPVGGGSLGGGGGTTLDIVDGGTASSPSVDIVDGGTAATPATDIIDGGSA